MTRFQPEPEAIGEESAEALYENAPCGYLSAAPDGTIARVNATFLRWTGYRREDLVGVKRFQDLLTVGGRIYHETHYAPLLRMQGSVREIAVDIVGADGGRLPVLVNSMLVADAEGEPLFVRTTVFDATERKAYERELVAARDRERRARERTERLQRITAATAAAPGAEAIALAVVAELAGAYGAGSAGVAICDPETRALEVIARHGPADPRDVAGRVAEARFDEGEDGVRGACAEIPLAAAPGLEGRLWLRFAAPSAFEPEERAFLLACAAQTALALERSRLYEETVDVAHSLQRSLLAGAPPSDPRFEIATLYEAAIEHLEVGGDWHDAFTLPSGRVGIVVGDVVGRGLGAASAMGQLRSGVRALAAAGHGPAAVLGHLDTFVSQVPAARYATLAYAAVDADTGEADFASAGHLPPVLLEPGAAPRTFMDGRSPPLGIPADGERRAEASFTLAPGGGFVLYTDGLVERRTEAIDAGLARLLSVVGEHPGATPAELADALPRALLEPGAGKDDVCLLAFRLTGQPAAG